MCRLFSFKGFSRGSFAFFCKLEFSSCLWAYWKGSHPKVRWAFKWFRSNEELGKNKRGKFLGNHFFIHISFEMDTFCLSLEKLEEPLCIWSLMLDLKNNSLWARWFKLHRILDLLGSDFPLSRMLIIVSSPDEAASHVKMSYSSLLPCHSCSILPGINFK